MLTQPVDVVEWMFPRLPRSAGRARIRFIRQAFQWELPIDSAETGLILLSELVTNACRHARSPRDRMIGVRVLLPTPSLLRIEVSDANSELPTLRQAAPEDESGRGLELVAALATSWGAHPRGEGFIGKTTWCELALPSPAGAVSDNLVP
ncbi:anti-sigma regulatory factor (Ser/Thr protein kinase) [Streptomyces sp. 1114.5]|uniref:ATP-binding protein n=1 Tax=Streptomyces sp. 1114.5 TaxID=1938830 RepID=UPI000F14A047|nr:ATP-binding protein [Streptomyces sp. 1114.5]RKT15830.1 anti-sigma regulatory factor (Ser/Thr protein kinase) [Streptomyces sp. 1114.5]